MKRSIKVLIVVGVLLAAPAVLTVDLGPVNPLFDPLMLTIIVIK